MTTSNKFTVYNASAGSGKTYTLVKEYLLLLLRSSRTDSYKNILAITFTNKAVAEMKSRVVSNLHGLTADECPEDCRSIMKDLVKETGLSEEKIRQKAKAILKSILHNYASFDISTIDRFTHKIIRTFAKDLGIPLNFEVELNTLQVLQEAVDRLINRAGEDKDLTEILINYTLTKADDDKSWDISREIFSFSKILLHENHQKYVANFKGKTAKDYVKFSEKLKKEILRTQEHIAEIATAFFTLVEETGLERPDFKSGYVYDYFKKLHQKNYNVQFGAKWQANIETDKLYAAKVEASKKQILDEFQPQIAALFINSKAAVLKRDYIKDIKTAITPLSLISEVTNEIEKIKKERSLVLISDFNPTIGAQVQNQPAPFIYERLGERYQNYFIDEFQDTSEMQWHNIIPLIDHALTSEQRNNEPSGLTLVGDAKQSIYRFRGGRAEQFINLYNETNPFPISKNVVNLPNNFRSAKNIVHFNNDFFKYVSQKFKNPMYQELFAASEQIPIKSHDGYVNISFIESRTAAEEFELHPEKVLQIIKDLEEKNTSKADICILTRTRKQSFAIANYLSGEGISIVSSESLLVNNSPEVNFINALLEYSVNPEDKNLKLSILSYLAGRLEIDDAHSCISANLDLPPGSFFKWLQVFEIDLDITKLRDMPLYVAVEYIIETFGLIETSNAYLQFYLDFVFEQTQAAAAGIPAFLELWELHKEKLSIVAPKTKDAVQIMTIHKSKGLEFPVVIYPFANTRLRDISKEHLWLPLGEEFKEVPFCYFKANKKMEDWGDEECSAYNELLHQTEFDAINIIYVAFTRASRKLYIISTTKNGKKESDDSVSGLLAEYLKTNTSWDGIHDYELGEITPMEKKSENEGVSIHYEKYYGHRDESRVINLVTRSGELWGSQQEMAINKGILVHNILSFIETAQDLPGTMEKFIKKEGLTKEEGEELHQLVSRVIKHPELVQYFTGSSTVYLEKDIIHPSGEILRPDRLNIDGDKVSILDYKTGELSASHSQQMEQYAAMLSTMGFEVANKILIYINNDVKLTFV